MAPVAALPSRPRRRASRTADPYPADLDWCALPIDDAPIHIHSEDRTTDRFRRLEIRDADVWVSSVHLASRDADVLARQGSRLVA